MIFALLIVLGLWLLLLTLGLMKLWRHYNHLTSGAKQANLIEILEKLLTDLTNTRRDLFKLEQNLANEIKKSEWHIQQVGIVRFNPFADTGGSQSFTVAILDAGNNGIVMTNLYARSGNRWYIKEVEAGRGREMELSREEEAAIKRAQLNYLKTHS